MARKRFSLRSLLLPFAAAAAFVGPAISSGCGGEVDSISQVDGLRVLAVAVTKPPPAGSTDDGGSYAQPGDEVTFKMTYYDGFVDPKDPEAPPRKTQIAWLGGCFDPPGDAYYGCYAPLAELLGKVGEALSSGNLGEIANEPVAFGTNLDTFTMKLPEDIISQRPPPEGGPHYGIAYVFFAVCAGFIGPAPTDSNGAAGSFPLACFADEDLTIRLGAESFVPGYTQIYAFADKRTNANPPVTELTFDGKDPGDDPSKALVVKACPVDDDTRTAPASCSREDPFTTCTPVKVDITALADVAEDDLEGKTLDGKTLKEVVWVDYFADKGNFDTEVGLVNDATTGLIADHSTEWIAPSEPGLVSIWAVVHDARGGATTLQRYIKVE